MTVLLRKYKGETAAFLRSESWIHRFAMSNTMGGSIGGFMRKFIPAALVLLVAILAGLLFSPSHAMAMTHPDHLALGFVGAAKIVELRQERANLVKEANTALVAVQAKAKAENRELTAEETAAQDAFDTKIASADNAVKLEEKRLDRERMLGSAGEDPAAARVPGSGRQASTHLRADDDPARGFANHREFLVAAIENSGLRNRADVSDERLRPLAVTDETDKSSMDLAFMLPRAFAPKKAAVGSDEQGEYSDTYGGFAVPTSRAPGLLQVGFEGDPTAGRTQDVPMQTPSVDIMARTDKDHSSSVVGGFTVSRRSETSAISSSRAALEMVTMKAAGLFGLAYATEELLADSPLSFAALIDTGFRTQMGAAVLNEKLNGTGGNQYTGTLNAPCKIAVAKQTGQAANSINGQNIIDMAARCWGFDNAIWIANHNTRPQLATAAINVGTGGTLLYQPSRQEGFPDMLWGRPVFYTEYAKTVGTEGDISLINFSQYLEGTYQPIQNAESVHVRFVNHERTFKLWTRNAGAPWWRSVLTPANGATLSPVVTLAVRA